MAMNGSTWRDHPFEVGRVYMALADNPDFTQGSIASGHPYQLHHIAHSHYDGASIFTFKCLSTAALVSWWWFDDAPENLCTDNFQVINQ